MDSDFGSLNSKLGKDSRVGGVVINQWETQTFAEEIMTVVDDIASKIIDILMLQTPSSVSKQEKHRKRHRMKYKNFSRELRYNQ